MRLSETALIRLTETIRCCRLLQFCNVAQLDDSNADVGGVGEDEGAPSCPSVKLIWNSFVLGRSGGNLNALDCFRLRDSGCRPLSVQGTLLRRRQSRSSHWLKAEIWLISGHLLGHLYPTTPSSIGT
jgi:hypothetical protein